MAWFFCLFILFIFLAANGSQSAQAIEDQHNLKIIFHSVEVINNHDGNNELDGEWLIHSYVNEIPMNFSSGTGLASVKADEKVSFINKVNSVNVPSNGTLRILLVGLEQDNTNTKLPYIQKDLENAIPNIKISGIEIGGKMIAAWYNISQTLINYDTDDPIGVLNKVYSIENNFGVGTHSDCSRANENVNDIQRQQSTSCDFILNYEIRDLNHRLPTASWHDWEVMDGTPPTVTTPAAVSNIPGQFKMAALNPDGDFFVLPFDYGWQEYTTLDRETSGSEFFSPSYSSQPAIITESPDRTFVFALGSDKSVWYSWFSEQEGTWSKWVNSGGAFVSPPTVLLVGKHAVNVYGVGMDKYVWERQMDIKNGKWASSDWKRQGFLGDKFKSSPTFVSPRGKSDNFHAFALSTNGSIWHGIFTKVTSGGPWPLPININWELKKTDYLTNNSKFVSQPGAIEIGYGKIGLFAQTSDNQLIQNVYNYFDGTWSGKTWNTLGNIFSSPVLASPSSYRTDIFAQNETSIIHKWYGN
jgi:hypothetical protein